MSYEKNIWKTGDIVTSEKLNHMEEGIESGGGSGGGVLVVPMTVDESTQGLTFQKTWKEIFDAIAGGSFVIGAMHDTEGAVQYTITELYPDAGRYVLNFVIGGDTLSSAYAEAENDYPVYVNN